MTLPDSLAKNSNALAAVSAVLICASLGTAYTATLWNAAIDYWLVWASFVSGFGGTGAGTAAVIMRLIRNDALRSN